MQFERFESEFGCGQFGHALGNYTSISGHRAVRPVQDHGPALRQVHQGAARPVRPDRGRGFIFKYTNVSNSLVGAPNLDVNFTQGSTVVGSNVNGGDLPVRPGQSATDAVGAVGNSGQLLKFTGCQMISYGVVSATGGGQPGTFTP